MVQPSSNLINAKANVNKIIQSLEGSLQILLSTKSPAEVKKAIYLHSAMILYFKKLQGLLSLPHVETVLKHNNGLFLTENEVTTRRTLLYWTNTFLQALQQDANLMEMQIQKVQSEKIGEVMRAMITSVLCKGVLTYATLPVIMMQVIFAIYILAIIFMIMMTIIALLMCMSPFYQAKNFASLSSVSKKDIIEYAAKESSNCQFNEQDIEISELDFLSENSVDNKSQFLVFFDRLQRENLLSGELSNCLNYSRS